MTRYELLDRIGVGGMAEIFRGKAVAAGGFEKPVAIKRILPQLSQDKRFVELLIAEAKVLSLLKHRNIVQIFDVGLGDDGKYFLVMEYVDGKDLGAVQRGIEARRKRIPFDLALHIGAEICEALEHAHSARAPDGKSMSLVHRDVSPSNVLLSRAGEVKLTDFGIAKRAEQEPTGHGAVRGKFAYISPEQARNEQLDPRSDVFSVAVVLWELITHRKLFSGLSHLEALRAVREAPIERPSQLEPRIHPDLDGLLMPALSRDRNDRPSAGEFGAKLRALRYSLDVTVGDPATELAKIIDTAEEVERASGLIEPRPGAGRFEVEPTEATVIRIRTADAFSMRDKDGTGVAAARQIIDRFEEEETRLAQLSGDQMRLLRSRVSSDPGGLRVRDSGIPDEEPTALATAFPHDELSEEILTVSSGRKPLAALAGYMDSSTQIGVKSLPDRTKPPTAPPQLPGLSGPAGRTREPTGQSIRGRAAEAAAPMTGTVDIRNPLLAMPGSEPQSTLIGPPPIGMPSNQPSPGPLPPAPATPRTSYPVFGSDFPPPRTATGPKRPTRSPRMAVRPWMLMIGALVVAALAFAITRAFISSSARPPAPSVNR